MANEENILFPAIRTIESRGGMQAFPFGSVANPIGMMEQEHDDAGNSLRRLRELTEDYTPPQDACPTYRVMQRWLNRIAVSSSQSVRHGTIDAPNRTPVFAARKISLAFFYRRTMTAAH